MEVIKNPIANIFKNETVFLIGGGPSLIGFDWNRLKDKNVIAINKAFQFLPNADILYWTDTRFYFWYTQKINDFKGFKLTKAKKVIRDDVFVYNDTGPDGLELDSLGIRNGNNSGYGAMNVAYHTGATKIVLLGYDMTFLNDKSHFHDGYPSKAKTKQIFIKNMIPYFDTIVEPLKEQGVEVWNSCPNSMLNAFPKCSIEEGLNFI